MHKISTTAELLLLSVCGLMTTVYEGSVQDINENVKDVWSMSFPVNINIGMESILKTVMTAIVLARGLTVHLYIAGYLLMMYPFFFGRGITLLLLWMFICAIRSVIVNLVALLTGCVLCSMYSELKPVCFEFTAAKAIEIACSVFMWLSVNDYHIRLRNSRRTLFPNRMNTKTTQITDSDLSLSSSDIAATSVLDYEDNEATMSEDSLMVKAAVDWLMRMAFGVKYENRKVELDTARAEKFLKMSPDELAELQKRIKAKLEFMENNGNSSVGNASKSQNPSKDTYHSSGAKHIDLILGEDAPKLMDEPNIEDLTSQSTGSQTKRPSKKLQKRLEAEPSENQEN